jgi:sugar/nucleoside kinase (ribokinase family)
MARILTLTLNPALDLTVQLPRLEPGQVNRSDVMHTHAAGKGVNVAQVLADLGHQLTVSGFLGEDNLQAFETLFAKRNFVDGFIRVPGRPAAISNWRKAMGASPTSMARGRRSAQRRSRRCLIVLTDRSGA